ncbi:hypothetical protein D3C76_846660 [compost metagenome]
MQVRHDQLQADTLASFFLRQALQQRRDLAQVALGEQVVGAGLDDLGRRLHITGLHRMTHRFVEMAMLAEPATGGSVQGR